VNVSPENSPVFDHFKVMRVLSTIAFSFVSVASANASANAQFNPRAYLKKIVTCPAINRAQDTQVDIDLRTPSLLGIAPLVGSKPDSAYPQTTLISIQRLRRHYYSCTGGQVYGRVGSIRYRNFRSIQPLSSLCNTTQRSHSSPPGRLPHHRTGPSWVWRVDPPG
jgi:hypothetical protein